MAPQRNILGFFSWPPPCIWPMQKPSILSCSNPKAQSLTHRWCSLRLDRASEARMNQIRRHQLLLSITSRVRSCEFTRRLLLNEIPWSVCFNVSNLVLVSKRNCSQKRTKSPIFATSIFRVLSCRTTIRTSCTTMPVEYRGLSVTNYVVQLYYKVCHIP